MKNNNCTTTLGKFQRGFVIASMALMTNSFMAPAEAAITFSFNYTDADGLGFNAAGSLGESRKTSMEQTGILLSNLFPSYTATLNFDVNGSVTEDSTLASASSSFNAPNNFDIGFARRGDVGRKILGEEDPAPDAADGQINVNFEDVMWGLDDDIDPEQFDFKSTMLHELMHAIGFSSGIWEDGSDAFSRYAPDSGSWSPYDQHLGNIENNFINSDFVIDLESWTTASTGGIGNSGVLWRGASGVAANNGDPIPLYSPSPYSGGSSVSHLDDDFFTDSVLLMESAALPGLNARTLSGIEFGILNDIGIVGGSSTGSGSVKSDNNGDGKGDILWRNNQDGRNALWIMNGMSIANVTLIDTVDDQNWKIVGRGDFNGDKKSDVLWRNSITGGNRIWLMDGTTVSSNLAINTVADTSWHIKSVNDFDGDGKDDILWRNLATGHVYMYLMNGEKIHAQSSLGVVSDLDWQIAVTADVDGDNKDDLIWRHKITGKNYIWIMDGLTEISRYMLNNVNTSWKIMGAGDLNGDNTDDIIWRNQSDGRNYGHIMEDGEVQTSELINIVGEQDWQITDVLDLDGDGKDDIFWRNVSSGSTYIYLMDGIAIKESGTVRTVNTDWQNIN